MRATALKEPGPVDQRRHQPPPTPSGRSTPRADPHKNWTERRGPVSSIADVTSSSGAIEWAYQYGPFGTTRTVNQIDPNASPNPLEFDAQYSDGNNLYDLRARELDGATGRFLSSDPASPAITDPFVAAYAYASDQPTLYDDPSGQCPVVCDLGNLVIGAGQGAAHLAAGTVDFVVHYPTYFDAIRNGVAQGGWSYLGQLALAPIEECANALASQDFRSAGRGCLKTLALAYGVGDAAELAGNIATRLGPDAAAVLRDETGSIRFPGGREPLPTQVVGRTGRLTNTQATDLARYLGYRPTNQFINGERVFTNGKKFIVQDNTSHIGGTWKIAGSSRALASKSAREATTDALLNPIGG